MALPGTPTDVKCFAVAAASPVIPGIAWIPSSRFKTAISPLESKWQEHKRILTGEWRRLDRLNDINCNKKDAPNFLHTLQLEFIGSHQRTEIS
jgi:hypothetical protein